MMQAARSRTCFITSSWSTAAGTRWRTFLVGKLHGGCEEPASKPLWSLVACPQNHRDRQPFGRFPHLDHRSARGTSPSAMSLSSAITHGRQPQQTVGEATRTGRWNPKNRHLKKAIDQATDPARQPRLRNGLKITGTSSARWLAPAQTSSGCCRSGGTDGHFDAFCRSGAPPLHRGFVGASHRVTGGSLIKEYLLQRAVAAVGQRCLRVPLYR